MRPQDPRLVTIAVSHYCEKARWALQRAGIDFEEQRHIQALHYGATLWHARTLFAPVLRTARGPVLGSGPILHWVDAQLPAAQRLFPDSAELARELLRWLELFDATLGVETRRWLYLLGFERLSKRRALDLIAQGTPPWQRWVCRLVLPLAELFFRRRLAINRATVARGIERIERVFGEVSAALSDGRRYLLGARFSAADLTFASLSALVLMPPEYGVKLLDLDELAAGDRLLVERLRSTGAGQFALRLYAEERHARLRASPLGGRTFG
jgi:glutathione S-transferase